MTDSPQILADSAPAILNAHVVVRFFTEVLATGDAARAAALLAGDFVDHDADPGSPADAEGVIRKLAALWQAFPDGRFALESVIAAGDRVAARSTFTGTQRGYFGPLPPTGRSVSVSFSDWYRIADGRIAEHWHDFDEAGLMRQLGANRQ
ncbi:ester cyclase [Pseudorhodoplanes sp.]|uniref:ester cyclase n=1 Tax=Pseudorhodoplanes sp. TaxID=1934341 RepID=UPI003D0FFC97